MSPAQSNREPEPVPYPTDTPHARTSSVVLAAHKDGSHGSPAHSMEYDTATVPTPLGAANLISRVSISATSPSAADIRQKHFDIIREAMEPDGKHYVWCFDKCVDQPPITPESLAELDMPRIINNPKLRHDVNFDRELHFRPNLDGSKGRQKIQQAEDYWKALEAEFCVYQESQVQKARIGNDEYWNRVAKEALVRLPKVLASVRDILKTLVPDYDQKAIMERLDVDHIMQQIVMGMCDLVDLGNWLSKVLKNHCAPMRDCLVDAMQREIRMGVVEGKHDKLVSGLRQLMAILEAMKLDVANHQIRHMRPLLIDDTINFQQRYNAHRISIGKISAHDNKTWLQEATEHLREQGVSPSPMDTLVSALLNDVMFNESSSICPQSFYLDADRLRTLRTELHTIVYHTICRTVLRELACDSLSEAEMSHAFEILSSSVAAIVGSHGKFTDRLENVAVEIVRVVMAVEGRSSPFDAILLEHAERQLRDSLRPGSHAFEQGAKNLHARLVPKIQARSERCMRLTAIGLQDMLVPNSSPPRRPTSGFGAVIDPTLYTPVESNDADEDLVRRFTHIVVLHWHVWSDLVYLADTEKDDDALSVSSSSDGATTIVQSASPSPTMPVAQAVFAPGRKWLPVGVTVTDVNVLPTPANSAPPSENGATSTPSGSDQSEEQSSSLDSKSRQPAI